MVTVIIRDADEGYVVEAGNQFYVFDELSTALDFVSECYEEEVKDEPSDNKSDDPTDQKEE